MATKYRDADIRWKWLDERGLNVLSDVHQHEYMKSLWAPPSVIRGVFCNSDAGTGKTVLAVLAAYYALEKGEYTRIIYVRNTKVIGDDIGFLPGDVDEKVGPHMRPIKEALDLVKPGIFEQLIEKGQLYCISPTHERGVTYDNAFIIMDECQNFSLEELQAEHTRATDTCKIVSIGSTRQVDDSKLRRYRGLTPFEVYELHYRGYKSVSHKLVTNYRGEWSQRGDTVKETVDRLLAGEFEGEIA